MENFVLLLAKSQSLIKHDLSKGCFCTRSDVSNTWFIASNLAVGYRNVFFLLFKNDPLLRGMITEGLI